MSPVHARQAKPSRVVALQKALEWWGVHVPQDALDPELLKDVEERVQV